MITKLYGNDEVKGSKIGLKYIHKDHYRIKKSQASDDQVTKSFGELFSGALGKVNRLQLNSDAMTQKMLVQPESVSIHSVMIAAQKAELALSMAKAVTDRVIRAYQNITNLR